MSRVIVLDSGPLGMVTNPRSSPMNVSCREWLESLLAAQTSVVIAEIVDYEVRRELLRAGKTEGLRRLDLLGSELWYEPLSTAAMRQAALFWADGLNPVAGAERPPMTANWIST